MRNPATINLSQSTSVRKVLKTFADVLRAHEVSHAQFQRNFIIPTKINTTDTLFS